MLSAKRRVTGFPSLAQKPQGFDTEFRTQIMQEFLSSTLPVIKHGWPLSLGIYMRNSFAIGRFSTAIFDYLGVGVVNSWVFCFTPRL